MKVKSKDLIKNNKNFIRIVVEIVAILSIPLIAMRFTKEVNWTLFDFLIAGILLAVSGFIFEFLTKRMNNKKRLIIGLVVAIIILYIWAELAVGVFTTLGS